MATYQSNWDALQASGTPVDPNVDAAEGLFVISDTALIAPDQPAAEAVFLDTSEFYLAPTIV